MVGLRYLSKQGFSQFRLSRCMPGFCYIIRDFSTLLSRDLNITALENFENVPPNTGVFKNASIEGGSLRFSRGGVVIAPEEQEVVINYSTKTCAEYYAEHGREFPQICNAKIGIISNVQLLFEAVEDLNCKAGL